MIKSKGAARNLQEAAEREMFAGHAESMQSIKSQQSTTTAKAQAAFDALLSQFFGTA